MESNDHEHPQKTHQNGTIQNETSGMDEVPEIEQCRWGPFYSRCCQSFRRPVWVLVAFCGAAVLQGVIVNGLINVVLSTLEKRFYLSSSTSGIIPSCYDIASLIASFPISYYGGKGCKPKYLGLGIVTMGLGAFLFSLPHFTTGPYLPNQMSATEGGLCSNASSSSLASVSDCDSGLSDYTWVFVVAQLLHGLGACPMWILGITYLDDNMSRDQSSLYIGIYYAFATLGPAIGFLAGGALLDIPTDFDVVSSSSIALDSSHPSFVGIWWLGFLIASFLCLIVGFLMFGFPTQLPGAEATKAARTDESYHKKKTEKPQVKSLPVDLAEETNQHILIAQIKQYFRHAWELLRNPTFLLLSLTGACEGLLLSGFSSFLPKIVEVIFETSAAFAAFAVGSLVVVCGVLGTFLGGWVVKRFNMNCLQILKLCTITVFFTIPFLFGFLLSCEDVAFQGVTSGEVGNFTCLEAKQNCTQCEAEGYKPVCGSNTIMYYNPCYAGCQSTASDFFVDCLCTGNSSSSSSSLSSSSRGTAMSGKCEDENKCPSYKLALFLAINVFVVTPTLFITMPAISATLRCVPLPLTSIAVGLQLVIIRLLGSIPGPPIFGQLLDRACTLWQQKSDQQCETEDSSASFCLHYNKANLSVSLAALSVVLKIASFVCFLSAWLLYRKNLQRRSEEITTADQLPPADVEDLGVDNPVFTISNNNVETTSMATEL